MTIPRKRNVRMRYLVHNKCVLTRFECSPLGIPISHIKLFVLDLLSVGNLHFADGIPIRVYLVLMSSLTWQQHR
jgi:hypothetical protein